MTRSSRREIDLNATCAFRREYREKIANGRFKIKCCECGGRLTKIPDSEWETFLTAGAGHRVRHTACRPN